MSNSSGKQWFKILGVLGATAVAAYTLPKAFKYLTRNSNLADLYDGAVEGMDHNIGWHKLPPALGLLALVGIRHRLREQNLYDTTTTPPPRPTPPSDGRHLTARTVDGTFNDLQNPVMGSAGTRFGRNVPLEQTHPGSESEILTPNPRTVSRELLTRHTFTPATTLNLLAGAWLQFMIRDWFSHGKSEKENPWQVPVEPEDKWHENPMRILRTRQDPTRSPADVGKPPTYVNTETHWWDASQLYGSTQEFQDMIRSREEGKVRIGRDHIVNVDSQSLVQQPNLAGWWVGQSLLFTLFALEHNAICDRLRAEYPNWSDEELFQHARLVNAALLAKIHTVEWTTGILGHPTLQIAMRANWWGVATEAVHKLLGRISESEVISGIPGAKTDHYGVPYAITEEFVAVYRMHPLIPDEIDFYSTTNGEHLQQRTFDKVAGIYAREVLDQIPITDIFYSFGLAHPGAIQLHNYPRTLQRFERPDGIVIDLAAHDILRSRELGVPRYNQFRRLLHLKPYSTFEEMTDNPEWAEEIRRVYEGDIEKVDLTIGMFAERPPAGFGFSDTAFRIFVLMASRRLNSDRFFTTDYTPEVYTQVGMDWINDNTMASVLLRHYPELAPALHNVQNAFAPWNKVRG